MLAALVALAAGLVVVVLTEGTSRSGAVRTLEEAALFVMAVAALGMLAALVISHMADWREPASEEDFERLVVHAEELAASGLFVDPDEGEFLIGDPLSDEEFDDLVRDALDDLPDLLVNALQHVAVVVSDQGRGVGAYGLYQGDNGNGRAHDRIVIFRDTLRRDFGHDPDLLREQVTRTVRHELAHHVGFDELGVSRLDL
ncbi:MAG TPA: metallopeptidase family protein [Solirubrobacteraceae bacterium]|jgi:predicted Zn-dependent protease with MMP-like domain|nr:metallopeptidase family protein [Solirubrobacteraceae bacterium]